MLIDASAVVAVLAEEPRAPEILAALEVALQSKAPLYICPTGHFEAVRGLAKTRSKAEVMTSVELEKANKAVDAFIKALGIKQLVGATNVAPLAIEAATKYGRGTGHPAKLNMGDCFAYGTAKAYRLPLLFIGDDFTKTDIRPVLTSLKQNH